MWYGIDSTWSLKNHKESARVDLKAGPINSFAISDDGTRPDLYITTPIAITSLDATDRLSHR
jgi:hypothetical protein